MLDGRCGRAQRGPMCAFCLRVLLAGATSASSALAVAGKELVEQQLQRRVLSHDVVFAQVVAAGGAGVDLRSEGPLETRLEGEGHTCEDGRFEKRR